MKIPFEPNFRTPKEALCKEELNKLNAKNKFEGTLTEEFRNDKGDLTWEAEQLAKSHGLYLEFDRTDKRTDKNWIFMMRITVPGGGPLTPEQWLTLDEISEKFTRDPQGRPSLRITTRQNIQLHWVKKQATVEIVKAIVKSGLKTLNGCGDNARNVMACPLSCHSDIFNANAWAKKIAEYFQLPVEPYARVFDLDPATLNKPEKSFEYGPQLLNRKFKIGFAGIHRDPQTGKIIRENCTEFLTNDVGIAPLIENGKVNRFQIYIGGGQGERNAKPTAAILAKPFGIVDESQLLPTLDAIVSVHQEWGDRQNRFWARLKYVVKKMGIEWFRERVHERLSFKIQLPDEQYDYGPHGLHLGWHIQPDNGLFAFGMFIENGRIKDGTDNGDIKTMVRELVNKYRTSLVMTPNQHLLFTNIPAERKSEFEKDLVRMAYGNRHGHPHSKLRLHSSACVGLDTCRLSYTESEKFEPVLIDELEALGWGDFATTIGLTGCERQCDRPATKAIGLIGSGLNRYQLKLMGTEDGRHQGKPVISPVNQKMYLRSVPREKIAALLDTLFKFYTANKKNGETLGYFHRRIGFQGIIDHLAANSATADLMKSTFGIDDVLEP
jgi:sulfite reductase (NADPH) hemoprotein beta-component